MVDSISSSRQEFEARCLAPYAMHAAQSQGREYPEDEHPYRGAYQRDRDRVLHSAAFRRLSGKTQVFTGSMGDYHRTRLTHTMEVASIARTLGRALRLNEDLIEALALLHDIGHPPFGHAGEAALDACLVDQGGFSHNAFALTLVRQIEHPYPQYPGLNLTREVLHSQEQRRAKQLTSPQPLLEAQVVDVADSMTYDAHDVDDAVKLGLLDLHQLLEVGWIQDCYRRITDRFGPLQGKMLRRTLVHQMIDCQVSDVLAATQVRLRQAAPSSAADVRAAPAPLIEPGEAMRQQKRELERFLFDRVYRHPILVASRGEAQDKLRKMFQYYCQHQADLPAKYQQRAATVGLPRSVADYLAGMTDHFCLRQAEQLI